MTPRWWWGPNRRRQWEQEQVQYVIEMHAVLAQLLDRKRMPKRP